MNTHQSPFLAQSPKNDDDGGDKFSIFTTTLHDDPHNLSIISMDQNIWSAVCKMGEESFCVEKNIYVGWMESKKGKELTYKLICLG